MQTISGAADQPHNRRKRGDIPAAIPARPARLPDGQTVRQPGYRTYDEIAELRAQRDRGATAGRWAFLVVALTGLIFMVLLVVVAPALDRH